MGRMEILKNIDVNVLKKKLNRDVNVMYVDKDDGLVKKI
jgi:hypothetical protein